MKYYGWAGTHSHSGERSIYVSDVDVGSDMIQLDDCWWGLWKWDSAVMITNAMSLQQIHQQLYIETECGPMCNMNHDLYAQI